MKRKKSHTISAIWAAAVMLMLGSARSDAQQIDFEYACVILAAPSATNQTDTLPESIARVYVGDTFYVEFWATDSGLTNTGLVSVYADLDYPENVVGCGATTNTTPFTIFPDGLCDGAIIDELGGSQLTSGIGVEPQWSRVAHVEFTAVASGVAGFLLLPAQGESSAFKRGLVAPSNIEYGSCSVPASSIAPPFPENSLQITTCTLDSDCRNEAFCVPDATGSFPGTCYVPKNRYLDVAHNPANDFPTARRLSVILFERSCGGAGNTPCISDAQCTGSPDGTTCDDVQTGSQVIGWFGQPDANGHGGIVDEANRHYAIWADATFPLECGTDELCPAASHCSTGLGASSTCRWDADDTEVPSTVVHLSGCHISPKRRDVGPGVSENRAANYYLIEAIAEGSDLTDPSNYSAPLELRTVVVWGDMTGGTENNVALPPDNLSGFLDILHQVFRFKDQGKATTAWLDLDPREPDHTVGFLDMLNAVGGFKDEPYPWDDPCTCAGLPPCE